MWSLSLQPECMGQFKKWHKKHKKELQAVTNNLDTYLKALNDGQKPRATHFGFLHVEQEGVMAIDQKGAGQNALETRLYVYPDEATNQLFVITLGDKGSQSRDVAKSRDFSRAIRKAAELTTSRE
ncbi:MAG: hypothetical protein LLF97_09600 [Planctomycetaceae bacterium]|nr:hypothetical protein [Planctomycetaceae bacterium]